MSHSSGALLVVGFTCRSLAQCAKRERFSPLVIDRCGDRDTRDAANKYLLWQSDETLTDATIDAFLSYSPDWVDPPSIIPQYCMLAGGTENDIHLIDRLSRRFPNLMKPEKYVSMRSWKNWRSWSERTGMFFPRSWVMETLHSLPIALTTVPVDSLAVPVDASVASEFLLKKLDQAGGLGISTWSRAGVSSDLELVLAAGNCIVQERIQGESVGVTFLSSAHGSIALGCTEAWPSQPHPWGPFIYQGSLGPISLPKEDWALLDAFAKNVSKDSQWLGLWQADFIRRGSHWYLLEINPRWTASMELLEASMRLELVRLHCLASAGQLSNDLWQNTFLANRSTRIASFRCFAKRVLYAPRTMVVNESTVQRWRQHGLPPGVLANEMAIPSGCWIADIPNEPMQFETGFPVCSIIGVRPTAEEARRAVEEMHRIESEHLASLGLHARS
jgi:predicted ATP-grasp superfamily ATP-dependent carboligase